MNRIIVQRKSSVFAPFCSIKIKYVFVKLNKKLNRKESREFELEIFVVVRVNLTLFFPLTHEILLVST